jgi:SAM-dependent methyltransferase
LLSSRHYDRAYYEEHRALGVDFLECGEWQRGYATWLVESLGWRGRFVLDVGCACGSNTRALGEAGASCWGVDVSDFLVNLGRARWGFNRRIQVCDAVNLHPFADEDFDGVHCSQVAEHWRPDHVELILVELARVTRPGGLFFCTLDTEEMGRDPAAEDPTHLCVRPIGWWHETLNRAGWDLTERRTLYEHARSYLNDYAWSWFLAERRSP